MEHPPLILHGTWLPDEHRFWLWGEVADTPKRTGGRRKVPLHPFQAAPAALRERLSPSLPQDQDAAEYRRTLWLPTIGTLPQPSPDILATGVIPVPAGDLTLAPWSVTGLLLPLNPALDLLLRLTERRATGADIQAWRLAALLAMELVAGQQVVPALQREGFTLRAVWQPRPTPTLRSKLGCLARSLPPLCRAAVDDPAAAPHPRMLLDTFLHAAIDATLRALPFLPTFPVTTPGGAWLTALLEDDPLLRLKGPDADALYRTWHEWVGVTQVAGDEMFRITFRLEPPADPQQEWMLAYLLQATDDPSLLVPAAHIWRERTACFTYLDRRFAQPQERLLRGLGYATRLFPPLEASLRTGTPTQARLSLSAAFTFLKEVAPLLEQRGFGVLVPSWWQGGGTRLRAKARATTKKAKANEQAALSIERIIQFQWDLALGDEPLDLDEFEQLVALKQPLVQVRGQWMALDPTQVPHILTFFRERNGQMSYAEVLRMGLSGLGTTLPDGVDGGDIEADGWLRDVLDGLRESQTLTLCEPPTGLHATLRPYQQRGFSWLTFMRRFGLGACLADDMGLGKCLVGESLVEVQGTLRPIAALWDEHATAAWGDGSGWWATPAVPLWVQALDASGRMTTAPVRRLYRQWVRESLRRITLADGSQITLTRCHPLLTRTGWSTAVQVGDAIAVPARTHWAGQPLDPDLLPALARRVIAGYTDTETALPDAAMQADRASVRRLLGHVVAAAAAEVPGHGGCVIPCATPLVYAQLATLLRRFGVRLRRREDNPDSTIALLAASAAQDFLAALDSDAAAPSHEPSDEQGVVFCPIVAIEAVAHAGWVYDLEIADHHNFVANGILCHNTIQTIALLLSEREHDDSTAPALIVCPTSVIGNWQRELERFAPSLRVRVQHGSDRPQGEAFHAALSDTDVVLTSYPLLTRDRATLTEVAWATIVLDEAQNIKNASAKQAQAARALSATTRIALTGTPVENRLSELWSIVAFLNPGYLGSEQAFLRDYARPIERTGDAEATARLKALTAPFILRRLKTDRTIIDDLPEKITTTVYCTLTAEQVTLYEAAVRDGFAQVKEAEREGNAMQRRGHVLALLLKLKQICNHPAQFLQDGSPLPHRSGKLERLTEILEEVYETDDRVLVFTQFAAMGHMLHQALRERFAEEVLFLYGDTPAKQRTAMVRQFQAPRGPTVFILSLKAGGTGLNLTRANHVVHFDRWWNPAVESQATDRAFRIGQTRTVQVHTFLCAGTLEEHIDTLIEHKRGLAESVLGTGEGWLTELSTDQVRDLVALR